ncbi:SMI1 / KNR4 family (SUKH-1) [Malonomonas rubra DSM 5091]|uniref:SMI1 / KNR4 family (SUKH-1) n=1 Tax=Malonomonas rubra DSM 5091 TaxID=1122189 RepID=A0A1M6H9A5_MALRU|nr:SMI1/KNR4 family protein [Malonomonas rubra]SHJ18818.1 SMI1 / KNR4 family (SUKH-1) [Malonomonas rubra DSM 5091]
MNIAIEKVFPELSDSEVHKFENIYGVDFPREYKAFVKSYGGSVPEANIFDIPTIESFSGIERFLGLNELVEQKLIFSGRLPEGLWPVAFADGGNLIFISVDNSSPGIYYFDHELEEDPPSAGCLFFISNSFSDFIECLRPFDLNNIGQEEPDIISVWVDPSLDDED